MKEIVPVGALPPDRVTVSEMVPPVLAAAVAEVVIAGLEITPFERLTPSVNLFMVHWSTGAPFAP